MKTSSCILRIEQILSSSKSRYIFDYKKIGDETFTEVKLDRNDSFLVKSIEFYIAKVDKKKPGSEVLYSFPSRTIFGRYSKNIEAVYNGLFWFKLGQGFKEICSAHRFRSTTASMPIMLDDPYLIFGNLDAFVDLTFPVFKGIEFGNAKLVLILNGDLFKCSLPKDIYSDCGDLVRLNNITLGSREFKNEMFYLAQNESLLATLTDGSQYKITRLNKNQYSKE